jgi:hypothetical protein
MDSFYFWCMIPHVSDEMDGCPASEVNTTYMTLSALIGLFLFIFYQVIKTTLSATRTKKSLSKKNRLKDAEFRDLQIELYGEERVKDSLSGTNHSSSPSERVANVKDDSGEVEV